MSPEEEEKRIMNLVATALPCSAKAPKQRRSDQLDNPKGRDTENRATVRYSGVEHS